jgi:hypothetical protein|tara:strand:- start:4427 stop:4957 length:531 start_codon:yes stop_codon:yes gene_type:complete
MANFNQYRTTPYATKALADRMKNLRNGRTQAQYGADIQSVQNPDLPSQQFRDSLGNMGDQDEYMEQNFDYGRDDAYKAANPKYWMADGSARYQKIPGMSEEYNANVTQQRLQAEALRAPQAPAPQAPAPQAPTPQAQAPQPSVVQQNMNQPIVKKPVQNYNAAQPANSGWQAGGWK